LKNKSNKLPNLLIPGYHKAGTTTLFAELSRHPDIFPSLVKEPFYFRPFINGKALPPIEDYQRNFAAAMDEQYLMEASPTYIYGGGIAAKKIQETLGDIKIVVSLRNPVDQLFSLYKHHLRFAKIDANESFLTFVQNKEDFDRQYYDLHLQDWFEIFGNNMKCVFFESLIQSPEKVIADIINWLGLDPMEFEGEALSNTNPGETYKHKSAHLLALKIFRKTKNRLPHGLFLVLRNIYYALNGKKVTHTISEDAKAHLKPIFAAHNKALFDLLSNRGYTNLPAWIRDH
jgi:hypothetical protein